MLGHLFGFMRFHLPRFSIDGFKIRVHRAIVAGQEFDLEAAGFLLQGLVGAGLTGLALEGIQLLLHLCHNVAHTQHVLLGRLELAQGFALLFLVANDAGSFFDQFPAVLRRGLQDLLDPALLNDGMAFGPGSGFDQDAPNVFQAARRLVDEVLTVAVSIESPGDHQFLILTELARQSGNRIQSQLTQPANDQRHLHQPQRLPNLGAVEDNVFHALASEGLGALLTQHPEDGVHDIAFAAAVWTHDGRNPLGELNLRLGKRLEAEHVQ